MRKHVPRISECFKIIENEWGTPIMSLKYSGTERFSCDDPQSKEWSDNWYQKDTNNIITLMMSGISGWGNAAQRKESYSYIPDSRVARD